MDIMHHKCGRDPHYKIWHTIGKAMIIFVYSGDGNIVFRDEVLPLERGVLCLIGPSKLHYTMPNAPDEYDRSKLFISEGEYRSILDLSGLSEKFRKLFRMGSSVYARIPEERIAEVDALYRRAYERLKSGEGEALGPFLCLMDYLLEYTNDGVTVSDTPMSLAVDYINKHYSSALSLDEMCAYLHISKYHFSRKFKSSLGMTVMEYVMKTRLAAAKDMLLSTDLSIGEVAERSGFPSLAYFSRTFKSKIGMTPSKFKRAGKDK